MSHKLGVCVPYRNREEHMDIFVPWVSEFLIKQGIDHRIYIAHQVDDKLFNRGAMKNIAYDIAKKDGCDYFVFHDIDMVPEDDSCDYSYPGDHPVHIAVRISQSDYQLKYQEYFGGAVIFTREQYEKVNGYSNDYWDWGMEDDDLYWRCYLNGYCDVYDWDSKQNMISAKFNGLNSLMQIPASRSIKRITNKSHTVAVLARAEQQEEKVDVYLIGDEKNRRFVEFPLFRRPGYDWGISYNNSRAYTSMIWNDKNEISYQWINRRESRWTWIISKVDIDSQLFHFYLNGQESDARYGHGTQSPMPFDGKLKRYGLAPYFIGHTASTREQEKRWFRGEVGQVLLWDRPLSDHEIANLNKEIPTDGRQLDVRFDQGFPVDYSGNDNVIKDVNVEYINYDNIQIPSSILPFRRDGKFKCLPHETEGIVNNKFVKGETTARNERRYIKQVQKGTWDIKNDGLSNLEYELVETKDIYGGHLMINVKL